MKEYLKLFIDEEYPNFIDKYLKTQTLERIKYVSQFCGCDYTSLYNPLFYYSRYDHSVVIAHMTYHFTHNKKATIAALLHDVGTPCFAHTIDYVFGDYLNQETSEKKIVDIIKQDQELLKFLTEDKISLKDLEDLSSYPILENNSPQLCTDRLDGVFHTCYIWLHTHSLQDVKEIYNDITILKNEDDKPELGFRTKKGAEKSRKYHPESNASQRKKGVQDSFFPNVTLLKYSSTQLRVSVRAEDTADSRILPLFPEN